MKIPRLRHTNPLSRAPSAPRLLAATLDSEDGEHFHRHGNFDFTELQKQNKQTPSLSKAGFPRMMRQQASIFGLSFFCIHCHSCCSAALFRNSVATGLFPSWNPALRKVIKLTHTQVDTTVFEPHHFLKSICKPTGLSLTRKGHVFNCGP